MKFKRVKWFIYVALALFLLFFTNDFGLINVEKTAIVAAIGIDKIEEGFTVTAQIARPNAVAEGGGNPRASITAQGKTVAAAIAEITDKTGWYLQLSFCNLLVIGESFLTEKTPLFGALSYFTDVAELQDSAILSACKGSAESLLTTATPLDNVSAFTIQKIFFGNVNRAGHVYVTNVKDFKQTSQSLSETSLLPIIVAQSAAETKERGSTGSGSSSGSTSQDSGSSGGGGEGGSLGGGGGGGSESSSGSSSENQGKYLYDAASTAVFKGGVYSGSLTADETLCFIALKSGVRLIETEISTGEKSALVTIKQTKSDVSIKLVDNVPTVTFNCRLFCETQDFSDSEKISFGQYNFTPELQRLTEEKFTALTTALAQKCKSYDSDIFMLKESFYSKYPRLYKQYENNLTESFTFSVKIKAEAVKG